MTDPRVFRQVLKPVSPALLVACLAAVPLLVPANAGAQESSAAVRQEVRTYDIPAGSLDRALNALAGRAGILLAADGSLTAGATSPGLQGEYTTEQALQRLLAGTGLAYRFIGANTVTLARSSGSGPRSLSPIAVSAFRGNSIEGRTPQKVTVINREQIEQQQQFTPTAGRF